MKKTTEINTRNPEKYQYAYLLYMEGKSQKEVCERVDVNPKTLQAWITTGGWKGKRGSKVASPDALINKLMMVADDLISSEDFADNAAGNCDAIARVVGQIKKLKSGTTPNDRVRTLLDFSDWLIAEARVDERINDSFVKLLNLLQDKYITNIQSDGEDR